MFQMMLFIGSIVALIIGALVVLIGVGAIAGCAGGLLVMCSGGLVAFLGAWSVIAFLLPTPEMPVAPRGIITLVKNKGMWS